MYDGTDASFGIVPIRFRGGVMEFLLVQHKAGHWGFPKGHPEERETPTQSAARELKEETDLSLQRLLDEPAFSESYEFVKRKSGKRLLKTVTYFIGFVEDGDVLHCPKEIKATAWGDAAATRALITFDEGRSLFDRVLAHLETHPPAQAWA